MSNHDKPIRLPRDEDSKQHSWYEYDLYDLIIFRFH